MRTYVAVDGGMSDNLRPMLYGARVRGADRRPRRRDARTPLATIAGMHCESGDVLVRDAELAAPRVGDVLVTPATGAYGHAMANNYNGVPRPPVIFCRDGEARVVRPPRDLGRPAGEGRVMAERPMADGRRGVASGSSAGGPWAAPSASCSRSAPRWSRRSRAGARGSAGVLSAQEGRLRPRSSSRSDVVVELIGGIEPARDYVDPRAARGQARGHREQAADRPARRGAGRRRARGRRAAPLRGGGRRGDPGDPRGPGEPRRDPDREGVRDRQRHDQLHPHRDGPQRPLLRGRAAPGAGAGLRRGRPDRGRRTAPTPRRRWRSSPGSPSAPR